MGFRVILDSMGTEEAPEPEVEGALKALRDKGLGKGLEIVLVGPEAKLRRALRGRSHPSLRLAHAPSVVSPHDKASWALRFRKDSSMAVGLRMLKEGQGDAFVSAGNTGAVMAFSLFTLGRLPNVKRPAIAALFPRVSGGYTLVLDMGANVDVRPQVLFQFAVMGSLAYKELTGVQRPRVGLLSVGEELVKGNSLVIETRSLLEASGLNFVGNVEGHEILTERADVVVMDGFVGNVVLKFGEGVASAIVGMMKKEIRKRPHALLGALLMSGVFRELKRKVDFEEYGGAPLLGVNGLVMICHGRSGPTAIKNAIKTALQLHSRGLLEEIRREIAHYFA